MLPVVSGKTIGLDNTCKGVSSSQEFFGKSSRSKQIKALNELIHYKQALDVDLSLLSRDSPLKLPKEERLQQMNDYIAAIVAMQNNPELNASTDVQNNHFEGIQQVLRQKTNELLGVDIALIRLNVRFAVGPGPGLGAAMGARLDLGAICRLDVVRTDDLKQSLEILGKPEVLERAPGFR